MRSTPIAALLLALMQAGCARSTGTAAHTAGGSGSVVASEADSAARVAITSEAMTKAGGGNTIGVLPFRVALQDPRLNALGYALSDMLLTDLSRSSQLKVLERSRLGEVLRELDLVQSGRVDTSSAPRIGAILRARRLLFGSLDSLPGNELRLTVRFADVATGEIQQAIDARAPAADILAAEKEIARRALDALGVSLTPAERALLDARQTPKLDALLAYGRGVQAELSGDRRTASAEFRRAAVIDPLFQEAIQRSQLRADAGAIAAPKLSPGVRELGAPAIGAVDRLNRPLDLITSLSRPLAGAGDPAFPGTLVTVTITVRRP